MTEKSPDIQSLVERLAGTRALVLGDAMLDRFVYGRVERISPEAPIPVLSVEAERAMPGGAGNVARNLAALGADVCFLSVVGDDEAGAALARAFDEHPNIEAQLTSVAGRATTVKTRFVAMRQQILRADRETTVALDAAQGAALIAALEAALAGRDVLILSDYGKGVLTPAVTAAAIAAAARARLPVIVDPKGRDYARYAGASVVTPNRKELAEATGLGVEHLKRRAGELHEFNPMLGHRGCRLGITFPEIYEMQARAIFEAACDVAEKSGDAPIPEVMIPLVATRKELEILRALVDRVAVEVFAEKGRTLEYMVGTMIELPRAALMAGEIAHEARFFSFGTNDLTQTTLGVSRDDASRFLNPYVEQGIYQRDPFVSLDIEGVGQLVELAAERGRKTRADLKLGICGEHGGDPASIAFCEKTGLDYVSASPYRVPIARLSAAQAALS